MKTIVISILASAFLAVSVLASIDLTGTYQLLNKNCKGEVATTVSVVSMNGTYVAKTDKGYLYSASVGDGGNVTINNGPKLICSGMLNDNIFAGYCIDTLGAQCNVQYKK